MNPILDTWRKDRTQGTVIAVVFLLVTTLFVLLLMLVSPWFAVLGAVTIPISIYIMVTCQQTYRFRLATWQALPDAAQRSIRALCAEERQTAYCRALRGYVTPHGMLLPEGFFAWEHIVSIAFWEEGRRISRSAIVWNYLSVAMDLFLLILGDGDTVGRLDPESAAQCRITLRTAQGERVCSVMLDRRLFDDGGVEALIVYLREQSPVELQIR